MKNKLKAFLLATITLLIFFGTLLLIAIYPKLLYLLIIFGLGCLFYVIYISFLRRLNDDDEYID